MDMTQSLGQVIRNRRLVLGLTQEELAERIGDGVRQAEVSRLECDRVTLPRRRRLECIAAALQVPLGELLATAGWSGADGAFLPRPEPPEPDEPPVRAAVALHNDGPVSRRDPTSLDDLRHALVRSQELHWQALQVLGTSRGLAEKWYAGRVGRQSPHAE